MRFKLKNMAACRISFLSVFLFSVPFMYMWFNWCIFDYKRSKNSCCLFYVVVWYIFRKKRFSLNILYVHNSWFHVLIYMVIVVMSIYTNLKILNRLIHFYGKTYETILKRILSLEVSISILNRFWMFFYLFLQRFGLTHRKSFS